MREPLRQFHCKSAWARRFATLPIYVCLRSLTFTILTFGYSDQAPAAPRSAAITIDKAFGYPITRMLGVADAP
jgi:hypothetical protein